MKLHKVLYLSSSSADKLISNPMIPWIIAEIKKKNHQEKVKIGVEDGYLFVYESWDSRCKLLFRHEIKFITRIAFLNSDIATFFYALRDINDCRVECYAYVFQPDEVMELFSAMKENSNSNSKTLQSTGRSLSNAQTLTSLCADISPNSSHFFEVFYVGKIRVSQKKVPSTFIDDALEKFRLHGLEKSKKSNSNNSSRRGSHIIASDVTNYVSDSRRGSMTVLSPANDNLGTSSIESEKYLKNSDLLTSRSGSINYPVNKSEKSEQNCCIGEESNRTMVFQIGKSDLHLISPDRKQILLHKHLKDVVNCVKGNRNNFHFGFTCRDSSSSENCIGYIFKCESESVANELVTAINLAHNNTSENLKKEKQVIVSCEHCPMVWFHKLCSDVESK